MKFSLLLLTLNVPLGVHVTQVGNPYSKYLPLVSINNFRQHGTFGGTFQFIFLEHFCPER